MSRRKDKPQPAGIGMTPSRTELGSFVRARRLELDLKQASLARQVGLSQETISNIEVGTHKYLCDEQLTQLAKALQCDKEELRKRMPVRPDPQPKTELGRFIRFRRKELGLSLSAFAKRMEMTPGQVKALEMKMGPTIRRYGMVKRLASALDLQPSVFVPFMGMIQKESKSELGQLICKRRRELGMSGDALAEKLDVSRQYISQIELGKAPLSRNAELIERFAQILELDANKLEALRPKARRLKRRLKQRESPNSLGGFLTAKRLELHLSQQELAKRAKTRTSTVSCLERGLFRPSPNLLAKLAKALNCQIPAELIPLPRSRRK